MSRIPEAMHARLPRGAVSTLDALRAAGQPLGTGDLQDLLDISRPTLVRQLNAMRDEGLVRWTGKSPKDPRAMWMVAD